MRSTVTRYGIPAVVLLALVLPALVLASRLPAPIAVHWGWGGAPNAHAPWWLVTPAGVRVRVGLLGWPRRTLDYDEIAEAHSDRIVPLAHGGWGWRLRPGRSAIVVRAGDGLLVRLRSGGTFLVTVDDAGTAAGLVNDYVARHRSPAS